MQITALGIFTNLYLVFLWLLAGSLLLSFVFCNLIDLIEHPLSTTDGHTKFSIFINIIGPDVAAFDICVTLGVYPAFLRNGSDGDENREVNTTVALQIS